MYYTCIYQLATAFASQELPRIHLQIIFFPSFFLKSELIIYWIFKITLKFRSSFLICLAAKNPTTITKKRGLLYYISFSTKFFLTRGATVVINIYIMVAPTTLIMIRAYWSKLCINVTRVPRPSSLTSEKRRGISY